MAGTNSSAGAASSGQGGPQAGGQQGGFSAADTQNEALSKYLFVTCAAVSAILIAWRALNIVVKYIRTVTCLGNDTQRYHAIPSRKLAFFKRNILYAPIFRKRHNREFQLSSAINVGTLPTRIQLVFLVGYLATNIAFCLIDIPFAGSFSAAAASFRNRTGTLAVVNMVCVYLRRIGGPSV